MLGGPSRRLGAWVLCGSLLGLPGCAAWQADQTRALLASAPVDLPAQVHLSHTPFYPQDELQCGPAALATVMVAAGVSTTPQALRDAVFLPARGGSLQLEMLAAPRRQGLVSTRIQPNLDALLHEVAAGHPVVVLLNLGLSLYPLWHYAVVIGYDLAEGNVLLRSGTTALQRLPMSTFEHTWKRSGQWAFVTLPPEVLPAAASEADVTDGRVGFERLATPEQAAVAYRVAWLRWPGSLVLGLGLGNALTSAGDEVGAVVVLERLARRHDRAVVWNNLAMTRARLGDRPGALQAAERALELARTSEPRWLAAVEATHDALSRPSTGP